MTAEERKKVNPKVVFFAGKAAPACTPSYINSSKRATESHPMQTTLQS